MWLWNKDVEQVEEWSSGFFDGKCKDWKGLDEKLPYVIEESRLRLQTLWDATGHLSQKISFLLGIVIALVGYVFTVFIQRTNSMDGLLWYEQLLILIYVVFLLYTFFILIRYQLPFLSTPVGTSPKNLFKADAMNCELKEVLVQQLEHYQKRIRSASRQNDAVAKVLSVSYCILIIYPVVIILIYSLCSLCSLVF